MAMLSAAVGAAPAIDFSRTRVEGFYALYGTVASPQLLVVSNVGDETLQIGAVALVGSPASSYFALDGPCATGSVTLSPGQRCLLEVDFSAYGSGSVNLVINSNAPGSPHSVLLSGRLAESAVGAPYALAAFKPPYVDFGDQSVGVSTAPSHIALTSSGRGRAFTIASVLVGGRNADDFTVTSTCQTGIGIPLNSDCEFVAVFAPSAPGPRSAEIYIKEATQAVAFPIALSGFGGQTAAPATVTVVEYYWATRDHYFISSAPAEIAALDAAPQGGWVRTGKSFKALSTAQADVSAVCRFYLPPQFGDSHFYGRSPAECDATHAKNPGFVYESPAVMYMFLPTLGSCPSGTVPVYRVFDARADANHRYMTDRGVRDQMVALGWLAEGDGPDFVVMCAPQ